ncbi:MAG: hypothetical protein MUP14_09635, partial [Dehalococcoidia bacterium]|nr:hypothetical protein [Dehalococcoidia bacterium]
RHAGQATSLEYTMTWAWRPIGPAEFAKGSRESEAGQKYSIEKWKDLPIANGFKAEIAKQMQTEMSKKAFLQACKAAGLEFDDLPMISGSPSGVEPLDDFVCKNYDKVAKHYGVKLSMIDVLKAREDFCNMHGNNTIYFMTMEIGMMRSVIRTPAGTEMEDLWIEPFFMYFDSANVILLRYLEIAAKRKQEDTYISEMLGLTSEGSEIRDLIIEEYPYLFGKDDDIKRAKEKEEAKEAVGKKAEKKGDSMTETLKKVVKALGIDVWFVKPGPYETHFDDRVTGIWFPDMQASVYSPSVNMLKAYMQVPGFKVPT